MLNLQTELECIDKSLEKVKKTVETDASCSAALDVISHLHTSQERALADVEKLYTSLNFRDTFPELSGLPLEFVRTLIMARDLKINIRKRAIGIFFEWDRLDQAVGGSDQALGSLYHLHNSLKQNDESTLHTGTKLHQQTRKAISKRTPALMTSIRKFNKYCDQLRELHKPEYNVPLPSPLPTQISILRDEPSLLSDVWINPIVPTVPAWLENENVRRGIRAVLAIDRCLEERRRLGREADNMSRWYRRELAAVKVALRRPECEYILSPSGSVLHELTMLRENGRRPNPFSPRTAS